MNLNGFSRSLSRHCIKHFLITSLNMCDYNSRFELFRVCKYHQLRVCFLSDTAKQWIPKYCTERVSLTDEQAFKLFVMQTEIAKMPASK